MVLQEIVTFFKDNITFFPEWFTGIFWHIVSAILIIYLLTVFFKALSSQSFVSPLRSVGNFIFRFLKSVFTGSLDALESPIKRPKTKLVGTIFGIIHTYAMCILFFISSLFVFVLLIVYGSSLELIKQVGVFGMFIFFFYLTWALRVQVDREWLALKEQWQAIHNKNE